MATSSPPEPAEARLRRARIALSLRHPFLANATMRLPFRRVPDLPWCETMATDGYHIWYRESWVDTLDQEAIIGVIAHEVLHVVFGHSDRRGDREPRRWNRAADHAINLLIESQGQALPAGGLCDRRYHGLAAEEIYTRLEADEPASQTSNSSAGTRAGRRGQSVPPTPEAIADPSVAQLQSNDVLDPSDLRVAALRDQDAPDEEARRQLRRELASEMRSKLRGPLAGHADEEIGRATHRPIDWAAALRRWLFDRAKSDWRSLPFSRRFVHRGLYMPSPGVEAPGHIVFAVDTSGSMSREDLARAFKEVRALRETFPSRLTVIQADAAIGRVNDFGVFDGAEMPERVVAVGRGGTDFRPVFEWIDKLRDGTGSTILIYATDGYGKFPRRAPGVPCVWVVSRGNAEVSEFPFGVVIGMRR